MVLTDTHTHLYLEQFDEDRAEVMRRAIEQGVERFFLPNIDSSHTDSMNAMVAQFPDHCFPMMGLHPCSVGENVQSELDHVEQELATGKYIAVGEIGMDLYWDKTFKDQQVEALKVQIEWAKDYQLPIIIHVRDAFDEIFEVMDPLVDDRLKGIFHCFTGSLEQAQHILDYQSFYLGLGGVSTFKNGGLDKVIPHLPNNRIVLETDAPYLAPTPYRGKRNESAYLLNIAGRVADLKGISIEDVADFTTSNSRTIFGV